MAPLKSTCRWQQGSKMRATFLRIRSQSSVPRSGLAQAKLLKTTLRYGEREVKTAGYPELYAGSAATSRPRIYSLAITGHVRAQPASRARCTHRLIVHQRTGWPQLAECRVSIQRRYSQRRRVSEGD